MWYPGNVYVKTGTSLRNVCKFNVNSMYVSPIVLAVKQVALCSKGHMFDPIKRSKLFQRIISQLTTYWVAIDVKWHCHLHWINLKKRDITTPENIIHSGSDHPLGIWPPSLHTAPLNHQCEWWSRRSNNHSIKRTTLEISAHTFLCYPCFMIYNRERKYKIILPWIW